MTLKNHNQGNTQRIVNDEETASALPGTKELNKMIKGHLGRRKKKRGGKKRKPKKASGGGGPETSSTKAAGKRNSP